MDSMESMLKLIKGFTFFSFYTFMFIQVSKIGGRNNLVAYFEGRVQDIKIKIYLSTDCKNNQYPLAVSQHQH